MIELRKGRVVDIPSVLDLHFKYQIDSIKEEDKKDGFITTAFTKDELSSLIKDEDGLFLCFVDDKLVAYVMCASWKFWSVWPMFKFMLNNLSELRYKDLQLSEANSYQYGPICIDKSQRGSDVLPLLFDFARDEMNSKYPILVTFINKNNPRSFQAHTKKLGLEVITEFEFNNNSYYELVYDTSVKLLDK